MALDWHPKESATHNSEKATLSSMTAGVLHMALIPGHGISSQRSSSGVVLSPGLWDRASAPIFRGPGLYFSVNLSFDNAASHRCPVASSLADVSMHVSYCYPSSLRKLCHTSIHGACPRWPT
ncbi:hypothetical protein FKM82_026496 [Ascaphus truei]